VRCPNDDYDKIIEVTCQRCSKVYEVRLIYDYIGSFDITCDCSATYSVRQYKDRCVSITHLFLLQPKTRLRVVRDNREDSNIHRRR